MEFDDVAELCLSSSVRRVSTEDFYYAAGIRG